MTTGRKEEEVMADFSRPRYFNPSEAVGYGLIDQVGCGRAPLNRASPCSLVHSAVGLHTHTHTHTCTPTHTHTHTRCVG